MKLRITIIVVASLAILTLLHEAPWRSGTAS